MHSWRLLIKPFLDSSVIYDMYNFKEPWDGPNNRTLLALGRYGYKCPANKTFGIPDSTTTNYVAVVGRIAARRRGENVSCEEHDTQQQAAGTFLVIEMADSQIQWTEPKDVRFDDVRALRSLAANSPHLRNNGYFYHETPGINAVLVDGERIFMFPCDSTPDVLTALLPPNEAKAGAREDKHGPFDDFYTEELRPNWSHCIGLPVWIVTVGLLLYQVMRGRGSRRQLPAPCP
jgi:hypothetical protein